MNFEDDIFDISQNELKIENDGLKNYKAKAKCYICEHQYNEAIKKLKSRKFTYVQVRAFAKDSTGQKVYGKFSAKKKVFIK